MAKVIKYDYGPMIVAALSSEGEAYEIIAKTCKNIPVPKEYAKGKVREQFLQLINKHVVESDSDLWCISLFNRGLFQVQAGLH